MLEDDSKINQVRLPNAKMSSKSTSPSPKVVIVATTPVTTFHSDGKVSTADFTPGKGKYTFIISRAILQVIIIIYNLIRMFYSLIIKEYDMNVFVLFCLARICINKSVLVFIALVTY